MFQNPDGSLAQAAMMGNALQKERREMKQAQREAETNSLPTGINNDWIDPMPEGTHNFSSIYMAAVVFQMFQLFLPFTTASVGYRQNHDFVVIYGLALWSQSCDRSLYLTTHHQPPLHLLVLRYLNIGENGLIDSIMTQKLKYFEQVKCHVVWIKQ